MFKKIKAIKDYFWSWFSDSGTILIARLEMAAGILLAAVQGLDWSFIINWDFTNGINAEFLIAGGIWFVKGVIQEIVRRSNATDL